MKAKVTAPVQVYNGEQHVDSMYVESFSVGDRVPYSNESHVIQHRDDEYFIQLSANSSFVLTPFMDEYWANVKMEMMVEFMTGPMSGFKEKITKLIDEVVILRREEFKRKAGEK